MAIGDPDAFGGDFGGEYSEGMDDATQSFEGPLGYAMGYGAEGANQAGDVTASMSVDNIPNNKTDMFGPQGMESPSIIRRVAEGGGMVNLRNQANALASQGRGGDTMLMHMRPDEVAGLASLGGVTRNPVTGLPEGFLLPALGAFLPGLMGIGGTGISNWLRSRSRTSIAKQIAR